MPRFTLHFSRLALLGMAGLASFSALALDVPNPLDPAAQALVKRFQADYARIKADPNYFKPPAAPMAMPCEVPQRDLYPPLGLFMAIPEESEKIRLASRKTLRDMGMDPDTAAKPMQYNNIRITPQLDSHFTSGISGPVNKMAMYKNDKLFMTSESPMKNGKNHGEQVQTQENYLKASGMRLYQMPGMENVRLVTLNGVEMMERRNCFIDGVLTKVQTCPKD